jgi:NADP-dependent 3-hydroxy acid dehydrogenase YdfG
MAKKLIVISGANNALGRAYLDYFNKKNCKCLGLSRSRVDKKYRNAQFLNDLNLLDKEKTKSEIEKIPLRGMSEVIFIHCVGKFKFEERGVPNIDTNKDGIDDEVYNTNVITFLNVVEPLIIKLGEQAKKGSSISFTMCGFGSISDKYNIPFWQSYTKSKDALRNFIRYLTRRKKTEGFIRGIFINISTADTGKENELRPFADKKYWLKPKEIVSQSINHILDDRLKWKEIDIYKPMPNFNKNYYHDLRKILNKWKREMKL